MLRWAPQDWKARGQQGRPKYVHMGANHPYPNSPKEAGEALARELGFEVLPAIQFALTPGDYTAQCLTLRNQGANYAYLGNTAGSNISVLRACQTAGVQVQFLGNVWGMDENAMKAAGTAANGVVFPVRTGAVWGGAGRAGHGDGAGRSAACRTRPAPPTARCTTSPASARAMLMVEAMETAAAGWRPDHRRAHPRRLLRPPGLGAAGLRGRLRALQLHRAGPSRHACASRSTARASPATPAAAASRS